MESNNNNINNHANNSAACGKGDEMVPGDELNGTGVGASVDVSTKEMSPEDSSNVNCNDTTNSSSNKLFTLKKWNAVAMWSWDVDCDTCAICRVHVMDACLKCQSDKQDDCVVVWGECNHSFHNCCMSLWVQQNNRCPLCQQDWIVQRIGK